MNKKLKKIIIVGATVLTTASSVGVSNAMQVKKACNLKQNNKVYVCLNGKIKKFDFKCISMFDILKWFDKNDCQDKFPSTDNDKDKNDQNNGNENIGDNNNQDGSTEDNNQDQDKKNDNLDDDNSQNQDKEDNNIGNSNGQDQDDNIGNDNSQNQDKEDDNNSEDTNDFSKEQVEVLNLVNKERKANGLKPLTLNKELSNVANIKSRDMIEKEYFDHTSPTYGSPFDMMKIFNISYKTAGENIAMGQKTPSEVMNSWMNSSGHRANILNSSYTELGVGIQKDSNGKIYWTQMFIGK